MISTYSLHCFAFQIHSNPPLVSVTISVEGGRDKDTAANIRETKEFTVNMISVPFVDNANACSISAPPDVSEWPISGLTKAPSVRVPAPRYHGVVRSDLSLGSCKATSCKGKCLQYGM